MLARLRDTEIYFDVVGAGLLQWGGAPDLPRME